MCDISEDEVDFNSIEGIVLPGGMPGTLNLEKNATVKTALKFAAENGKLIGAICAAPSILGKAGLLKDKRATCFPGFEEYLFGACFCDEPAVRDGNIITSRGAGAALEFGFFLLAVTKGDKAADGLRRAMKYI